MEARDEQLGRATTPDVEPMLDVVHGIPGFGKSRLIKWIRELFEEIMGWKHGVQFICLAFQNVMAASIDGFIIHHWSGIPVMVPGASRDRSKFSTRCQCMRFIVIGELSMPTAELFGQLEIEARAVTRKTNGHTGTCEKGPASSPKNTALSLQVVRRWSVSGL